MGRGQKPVPGIFYCGGGRCADAGRTVPGPAVKGRAVMGHIFRRAGHRVFEQYFHQPGAVLHGKCFAVGIPEPDPVGKFFEECGVFPAAGQAEIISVFVQVGVEIGRLPTAAAFPEACSR